VQARLTIVGGGEQESLLRQMAAENGLAGQVTFTGQLSEAEKDQRLRAAHLLLHTSLREGWGLNVLEANAMGTPAAVYPVAGLIESTLHDQTGIVSREETPESLAQGILALLEKPEKYQQLRINARQRSQTFHWSRVLPPACDWLEQQASRQAGGRR
jgi:glycosyltransferase involved in cell wall biosynthesis